LYSFTKGYAEVREFSSELKAPGLNERTIDRKEKRGFLQKINPRKTDPSNTESDDNPQRRKKHLKEPARL
jgi:hypothetical protein